MALMNNNSIQINNYLQGQMSADEKKAFEEQLAIDKELQHEVAVQRRIIAVAVNAGLKAEFAKAIRKKAIVKRMIKWGIAACIFGAGIVFFAIGPGKRGYEQGIAKVQPGINIIRSFIAPPLRGIDIPFSEYIFDAEKGSTIFHPSGSIIYFPPSALVDGSGTPIKGKVKITYREFNDPLDFFVSGIPMSYDSAGRKYNFESSGMCEINAYKDNKAVFINQYAKPRISLSAKNKSPLHNVYFLDTIARSWKYIGKDSITAVKDIGPSKAIHASTVAVETPINSLVKPLKPMKASEDRPTFNIEIDPGSFDELFSYDKLKFEVVDESTYKAADADEHWSDVKLERTATEGIYNITFTNAQRKVSYKVRPVLAGADYAAAMKVFNEKNKAYEAALKNRIEKDRLYTDSINLMVKEAKDKWSADSTWNEKMNVLIIERNKKMKALYEEQEKLMKEQQRQMEEQKKQMEEQEKQMKALEVKAIDEFLQMQKNLPKYTVDMHLSAEIMRSFTINNFGVWNCDHPQYPDREVPILASYTDDSNNSIPFSTVAVVYKGFNGITQFAPQSIRVIPRAENMIWGVNDATLYYFSYKDFMNAGIVQGIGSYTFKMRRSKPFSSYYEMREWADKF
jgi:hypothetical protein